MAKILTKFVNAPLREKKKKTAANECHRKGFVIKPSPGILSQYIHPTFGHCEWPQVCPFINQLDLPPCQLTEKTFTAINPWFFPLLF